MSISDEINKKLSQDITSKYAYFAQDGSYGDALGMAIIDTALWTAEDWEAMDEAIDYERVALAQQINDRIRNGESE